VSLFYKFESATESKMNVAKWLSAFFVCISISSPAIAWETGTGTDPMNDVEFGWIAGKSALNGEVILGVKCWLERPQETMLSIVTDEPWTGQDSYPRFMNFRIRVDNREPADLLMLPTSAEGKFSADIISGAHESVERIIADVLSAKTRIVFDTGAMYYEFDATKLRSALSRVQPPC
jgi:hypothetical protein